MKKQQVKELKEINHPSECKVDYLYKYIDHATEYILLCDYINKSAGDIQSIILSYSGNHKYIDRYIDYFIKNKTRVNWLEFRYIGTKEKRFQIYEIGKKEDHLEYFL